jgi:hypothetical protein
MEYNKIITDEISDDKEEYFEIKNVIAQLIINIKPKIRFIENSIPTYVATPLPPLNLSHTGNTCPKKALNDAIKIYSG